MISLLSIRNAIRISATFLLFTPISSRLLATTPSPVAPIIPNRTLSVIEQGASGDGKTLNTTAIQKTIDQASAAGGGTVLIPAGTFVSGALKLKSNIDLHLAKGAVLQMSADVNDFPILGKSRESLLLAENLHDVQISGEGTIDGQGEPWWTAYRKTKGTQDDAQKRPGMIIVTSCDKVRLTGFTTKDPPNCHVAMGDCANVTIEGLTLNAPDTSTNTDGLNLRVRNCVIRKCHIATGDDNIVLLTSHPARDGEPAVQNIAISDCTLGVGHGLSIGSYTAGGIRNVTFENINFEGTSCGIRMKANRDRGGAVESLSYKNLTMKNVSSPINISSYYPKEPKSPVDDKEQPLKPSTPIYRDISIENVTVQNENLPKPGNAILIWGVPEQPITDVTLKNVRITAQKGAVVYNAKDVRFENVQINTTDSAKLTTFNAEVKGMEATPLQASGGKQQ